MLNGENVTPYNISYEKSDTTIRNFAKTACEVFPERNMTLAFANPEDERSLRLILPLLQKLPKFLTVQDSAALDGSLLLALKKE